MQVLLVVVFAPVAVALELFVEFWVVGESPAEPFFVLDFVSQAVLVPVLKVLPEPQAQAMA